MTDPRVRLVRELADHEGERLREIVGGPLPTGDQALIALFEHLYDQPEARYQIRQLIPRAMPHAAFWIEPNDFWLVRTLWRLARFCTQGGVKWQV